MHSRVGTTPIGRRTQSARLPRLPGHVRAPARLASTRTALAAAVLAAALGAAGCSGTAKPAPTPTISEAQEVDHSRVIVLLVQCFADQHLLPAASLDDQPAAVSSWLRNGKVIANDAFTSWYRGIGAGVTVDGQMIGAWAGEIVPLTLPIRPVNPRAWPIGICGPMPHL
jgi:hypothetical protein